MFSKKKRKSSTLKLQAGCLLLQFIDFLEKRIYSASEGNQTPSLEKGIVAFFRTNKKSCEDWFSKMRQKLIHVSVGCSLPCDIISNASQVPKKKQEIHFFLKAIMIFLSKRIQNLLNSIKRRSLTDEKLFFNDFEFVLVNLGYFFFQDNYFHFSNFVIS